MTTSHIEALRAALAAGPTPTPWNAAYIAAACNAAPELLAEVDRLKAETQRLSGCLSRVNARCDHLGMSLRDITAERDALRADAERYRWLRDSGRLRLGPVVRMGTSRDRKGMRYILPATSMGAAPEETQTLDAAIDALKDTP